MKVALVTNVLQPTVAENLAAIERSVAQAAEAGAELVLFPETALTGFVNFEDPAHDLPLGQPVPGPATDRLCALTKQHALFLGLGLLERAGDALYDSALLLGPDGGIFMHYRRIQPQWHNRRADPQVYRQGRGLMMTMTALGNIAFLLCGDLFDDAIVARVRRLAPDYLLVPFARCFADGSAEQACWEREEEPAYTARVAQCGCTTLLVNLLSDPATSPDHYFGGAIIVNSDGAIHARWPLGTPGMLLCEVS